MASLSPEHRKLILVRQRAFWLEDKEELKKHKSYFDSLKPKSPGTDTRGLNIYNGIYNTGRLSCSDSRTIRDANITIIGNSGSYQSRTTPQTFK
jgi:hypothetical protein